MNFAASWSLRGSLKLGAHHVTVACFAAAVSAEPPAQRLAENAAMSRITRVRAIALPPRENRSLFQCGDFTLALSTLFVSAAARPACALLIRADFRGIRDRLDHVRTRRIAAQRERNGKTLDSQLSPALAGTARVHLRRRGLRHRPWFLDP